MYVCICTYISLSRNKYMHYIHFLLYTLFGCFPHLLQWSYVKSWHSQIWHSLSCVTASLCPRFVLVMVVATVSWFISDVVSKVSFLTMTLHQGGSTRMYELTPDSQPSLLSTFSGNRRFSRFGGVLHLSDLDNDGLGRKGTVALAKKMGPPHRITPVLAS